MMASAMSAAKTIVSQVAIQCLMRYAGTRRGPRPINVQSQDHTPAIVLPVIKCAQ
jgi:hypothetical protein